MGGSSIFLCGRVATGAPESGMTSPLSVLLCYRGLEYARVQDITRLWEDLGAPLP